MNTTYSKTVSDWLSESTAILQKAGISSARLDCLILLEDELRRDRSYILAHPEVAINQKYIKSLSLKLNQRKRHVPIAYIRKKIEFYRRTFFVNNDVLVPRPESESMISLLKLINFAPGVVNIADIGTGSGVLGITAALEISNSVVDLYDNSREAIEIAKKNSKRFGIKLKTRLSDLLTNLDGKYDVMLANLPYVPLNFPVSKSIKHEPENAIFSDNSGLSHYKKFWNQLKQLKSDRPDHIIVESLPQQHAQQISLAKSTGYKIILTEGFIQYFKLA